MAKATPEGFQLYDIKIRLSATRDHEVRRERLTAPEIMLLAHMHGGDSVAECRRLEGEFADRTDAEERARLVDVFERGTLSHRQGLVANTFGAPMSGGKLPRALPDDFAGVAITVRPAPADPVAAAMA